MAYLLASDHAITMSAFVIKDAQDHDASRTKKTLTVQASMVMTIDTIPSVYTQRGSIGTHHRNKNQDTSKTERNPGRFSARLRACRDCRVPGVLVYIVHTTTS